MTKLFLERKWGLQILLAIILGLFIAYEVVDTFKPATHVCRFEDRKDADF